MADVAKRLAGPTSLTAAAATVYTVPASTTTIVRNIHVANTSASAVQFTLSVGADAAGTRLWAATSIQGGGYLDWSGFLVLAAAEVVQAYGSTTSVLTLTISGVEAS